MLGYPELTDRADIDIFLRIWLRTTAIDEADVLALATALREAVSHADVIGLPRRKQFEQHRLWAAVERALAHFDLLAPKTLLTHTALHRLLQHALLFRPLLADLPFVGVVSSRDVGGALQELFGIRTVRWHGVRGERDHPGSVATMPYPDGFKALRQTLTVPYRGAVFLVGAGVFGKVYCHWIKARGGIAIDIGAIFDSWAQIGRGGHPVRSLDVYREMPTISREAAMERYNELLDHFELDVPRATPDNLPPLPEQW